VIQDKGWDKEPALMAAPLSNDLRKKIVESVEEEGMSRNEAAEHYGVAPSTAIKLMQKWTATGSYAPAPQGGTKEHKLTPHREKVERLLEEKPDMTLKEIVARLKRQGITVGKSSVDRFLNALGLRFKKNSLRG